MNQLGIIRNQYKLNLMMLKDITDYKLFDAVLFTVNLEKCRTFRGTRYYPFGILCCIWGCSSRMRTRIGDDVRNPRGDVIPDSVLRRSNSVFASQKTLRELYLAKTEFDLRRTESGMTSPRGFLTSSPIRVRILLLHPQMQHRIPKG